MSSSIFAEMFHAYECKSDQDGVNALREIMQSIALLALSRHDFFNHAAFYGGTALRILYGLNRGSEDIGFALLVPDADFDLSKYAAGIEPEFSAFGLAVKFSETIKMVNTNIQSGFLKSNIVIHRAECGLGSENQCPQRDENQNRGGYSASA